MIIKLSQSLIHQVSVSDYVNGPLTSRYWHGSQSLIHQVSVSDEKIIDRGDQRLKMSQSLIHQVSVSDVDVSIFLSGIDVFVSIPYSSGLSFR